MIADYVNDQIDVVGRAILGLTLACARCHDHKFDPITTEDYYSLAGIFFSSRLVPGPIKGNTPLVRVPLLPQVEIAAIEAAQVRDKGRAIELSREISTFGEREYQTYLDRKVDTETNRYLIAAWEVVHRSEGEGRPDVSAFAKSRELDATSLNRWIVYFDEKCPHPALNAMRGASTQTEAERIANEIQQNLVEFVLSRSDSDAGDLSKKTLSNVITFRSDDRRITKDESHHVTVWPNRGRRPEAATSVTNIGGPTPSSVTIDELPRTVLRFSGKDQLQASGSVPVTGSLFVVFRPDPAGMPAQRIVGWEDAAVGQHGLGIMTEATGAIHAILRRNGANGDVVVPSPIPVTAQSGFQLLCVTWGPAGVTVYRDGQPVGSNKAIDSVSSDPAITALIIGGPGSGSSPGFQGDLAELRVYDVQLDDESRSRVEADLKSHWSTLIGAVNQSNPIEDLHEELVSANSPFRLAGSERDNVLPGDFRQRLATLRDELETIQKKPPIEIPRAVVILDGGPSDTPHQGFHDAQVYIRGNHSNPGRTVPRGVPKAIAGTHPPVIREGSGRRELADWLTDPHNPLTARVMVNRIWQHHFGNGLVQTSANLGAMGERPTHPELLDFLAARFVASGWSVKAIHRLIMLSHVYQQTSASNPAGVAIDPENQFLWRWNRHRLEAESFRDSLFAVTGGLDLSSGGPGFQDVSTPRRSLYLMATRTGSKTAEFGPLFDAPDCSGIVERRNESIVAPQALFLMNDPLVTALAASLAERISREVSSADDRLRIERLYKITLGRLPTDDEIRIGVTLLTESRQPNAWAGYCRLVVCTNEFMFVD